MVEKFKKFITKNNLIKPEDKILLAVSGGIDSMVMAQLFLLTGNKIGIAHCNFSLRAGESDIDQELVQNFAVEHNIQLFSSSRQNLLQEKGIIRPNGCKGVEIQMVRRDKKRI